MNPGQLQKKIAVNLYLDIINLFLDLLQILAESGGN